MKKWINNFYGGLEKNVEKVLLTTEVDIPESSIAFCKRTGQYTTYTKEYRTIVLHDSKEIANASLLAKIDRTMVTIERKQDAIFKYYLYLLNLKKKINTCNFGTLKH
jgi:hypothetical protein